MVFGLIKGAANIANSVTDTIIDVASDAVETGTLGAVKKDEAETLLKAGYAIAEVAAMTDLTVDIVTALAED